MYMYTYIHIYIYVRKYTSIYIYIKSTWKYANPNAGNRYIYLNIYNIYLNTYTYTNMYVHTHV